MNLNTRTVLIARMFTPALAFVALTLAAASGTQFSREADAANPAAADAAITVNAVKFEYFPDLYVNQGKHVEQHIQAF